MNETPHKIAQHIAAKNSREMSKKSTNKNGLSQGQLASQALERVLTQGICATCARLAVDVEKRIGCSYDDDSPANQAREHLSGVFLSELQCLGYIMFNPTFEVYVDEDGVVRYRYT